MVWRVLTLSVFGIAIPTIAQQGPSGFYIVSHFDSDVVGASHYRILDVRPDGSDSVIRYVHIGPVRTCPRPRNLSVRAAETRLRNVSPTELSRALNPCDTRVREYPDRKREDVRFTFEHAGIVATCGSVEISAGGTRYYELAQQIANIAFGSREVFWGMSEEEDLEPQRVAEKLLPEIAGGRYDAGMSAAFGSQLTPRPARFREVLSEYAGIVRASAFVTRKMLPEGNYEMLHYVEPAYPSLGVASLILGTVDLRLEIDPSSGGVRDVMVTGGPSELAERTRMAALDWQFAPKSVKSRTIRVGVDFKFQCPGVP